MTLDSLRADKFLWHIRQYKSRTVAQAAIINGHIRLNGQRMDRPSNLVHIGDIITLPHGDDVAVLQVIMIPKSRLNAADAATCYNRL